MSDFWKTKEGKILSHAIHEHSSAMFILGSYINLVEKDSQHANSDLAKKALKKAKDAIDYAYTRFKELYEEDINGKNT